MTFIFLVLMPFLNAQVLNLATLPITAKTHHRTLRFMAYGQNQTNDSLDFYIENYDDFFVNTKYSGDLFSNTNTKSFNFRGKEFFILTAYEDKILAKYSLHEYMGEVACLFELHKKNNIQILMISCLGHQNAHAFEEAYRIYAGHQELWLWGEDVDEKNKLLNTVQELSQTPISYQDYHDYVFIPRKEKSPYVDSVSN